MLIPERDDPAPVTEEHVAAVCRPGQPGTCAFLIRTTRYWACAKHSPMERAILQRRP